ncbi:acetylxylan esterase [Auraticoccus sp. F435]|uniref:Acetylxylan esterase n=1 Tax=Auraticoccus cholistanensis TaxID=2656650 RepID=A0A6A9V0A0_9ACTN|nr:acetylxylan esterase [Auraticoccus cholistanensis]MVA75050.1 acetylxylan esterase [Auraticoccus cholistanensis]
MSSLADLDPLTGTDGRPVPDATAWDRRRHELRRLFEAHVYGPWPGDPRGVELVSVTETSALDGTARLVEAQVRVDSPAATFPLLLVTPAAPGPHPCFLGLNFHGNHTVLDHPAVTVHDRYAVDGAAGRGDHRDSWDVAGSVAAGYAVATVFCGDVVQDHPDLAGPDLDALATPAGRPGALMAWAWALSAARAALSSRPEVDPSAVTVVGHSRMGKAALVASGWDDRFAAVVATQSGTGGASPSRKAPERCVPGPDGRPEAETVKMITRRFPHWFAPAFAGHADRTDELPVDQHQLLALSAPRPTLLWNGTEDLWADPAGTWDCLQAAAPVFRFLGADQPEVVDVPEPGQTTPGTLAYGLRPGGHSVTREDWAAWRRWCACRPGGEPQAPR